MVTTSVRAWFGRDERPPTSGVSPIWRLEIALCSQNVTTSVRRGSDGTNVLQPRASARSDGDSEIRNLSKLTTRQGAVGRDERPPTSGVSPICNPQSAICNPSPEDGTNVLQPRASARSCNVPPVTRGQDERPPASGVSPICRLQSAICNLPPVTRGQDERPPTSGVSPIPAASKIAPTHDSGPRA